MKFQIRPSSGPQPFYWCAIASNGNVLCKSETYASQANAVVAVQQVKAGHATYEVLRAANDQWFFHIKAFNGRVLAHSETYRNRTDAQAAADHVRRWAPTAPIQQLVP